MRALPETLEAHLVEGATTMCRCWRLTRRDGAAFGFTDHDRDIVFDGVTFEAHSALEAAETSAELGFAVGGGDVAGALSAAAIEEGDILAGLYDDATVECWIVNWASPEARVRLDVSSIGEIRRADGAFVAELRSPLHRFDEERGLLYRASCSADLGDGRCRVDLTSVAFSVGGIVQATDGRARLIATALDGFAAGWFTAGRLVWLDGTNAGLAVEVERHRQDGAVSSLDLWQPTPRPIAVGDAFRVTAGCDKRHATCRDRFGNVVNFRGFPHMPGNAFLAGTASEGEPGLDGGSFFR